jgi:hypothetical protein
LIYDSEADLKKFEVTPKTALSANYPFSCQPLPMGGANTCLVATLQESADWCCDED